MEDIRKILLEELDFNAYKELFNSHLAWSKENGRVSGTPKFWEEPGSINVFGFRCNTEADFNFGKYNDYLVFIYNNPSGSYDVVLMVCTVDPAKNNNRVAHLRQGVWNSYVIRPHKWEDKYFEEINKTIPRWAICQDLNEVEIVRTNGKGVVIEVERGMYGINIHEGGDTSAGCTMIKIKDYFKKFLVYVYNLVKDKPVPVNHRNITYTLTNHSQLEKYLSKTIKREEKAEAVNGTEGDISGDSKPAVKL